MKENGLEIKEMERETTGLCERRSWRNNTQATGERTNVTVQECTISRMVVAMKVCFLEMPPLNSPVRHVGGR